MIVDKRKKAEPKMVMEAKLIFLEPELWKVFKRMGKVKGKTRSTFIRCSLKDNYRDKLDKIKLIDWEESNL